MEGSWFMPEDSRKDTSKLANAPDRLAKTMPVKQGQIRFDVEYILPFFSAVIGTWDYLRKNNDHESLLCEQLMPAKEALAWN
jgi:hypothetical protein